MINGGYNELVTLSKIALIAILRGRFIVGYPHPQPVWKGVGDKISSSALAGAT